MATVLTAVKSLAEILSLTFVQSNTIIKSASKTLSAAFFGMMYVKYSRLATGSLPSTVFRVEASPSMGAVSNDWVTIALWQSGNQTLGATVQTLLVNAASGATTLILSASLNSAMSSPVFIYNSANSALSEWNWFAGPASVTQLLMNALANSHVSGQAMVISLAEMWSIPIPLEGVNCVRLVVDNCWQAVTQKIAVRAEMVIEKNIAGT